MAARKHDEEDRDISEELFDGVEEKPSVEEINAMMGAAEEIQKSPRVTILVHNQEGPAGDQAIFVAVNGVGYLIPRETPVSVPRPILAALENAVETKYYREQRDGQEFGPPLERTVRRYSFEVR